MIPDNLKGLLDDYEEDLKGLAALHYATFRSTGGFGVRVAATLAATAALAEELAATPKKDPVYARRYVLRHTKLFTFLRDEGEAMLQTLLNEAGGPT